MVVQALKWVGGVDGFLELIDQRRLPGEFVRLQCRDVEQLYNAIKTLTVRGAPAIGVAGAYGLVLAIQNLDTRCSVADALECLKKAADYLGSSRPTAANLFWAPDRVKSKVEDFVAGQTRANLRELQEVILGEANAICQEDVDMCRRIGENGEKFIKEGAGILTHCNAGALATAGQGTALSVMFEAHKKGKKFKVYVDETRPLLQGARLTAWELKQAGIDVVVICDNMAGWLMKQGKISTVITGADRIAANGDAANKIGTYSLSVLAREHSIPFYIAAPSSTFDLSIKSGGQIPIEQRAADEVRFLGNEKITPDGVEIYNPAFDITEARDITAIITERGVIERPTPKKISEHFK
ncbi:MAG: S-methyl-5-thioribose-1-phosphate isomerase, partial [Sedimentisphaerales bacterium]|nr:S-methyl-5-thioribose-1-phosphate isomerase [Sedimentisphaerales bacterium]